MFFNQMKDLLIRHTTGAEGFNIHRQWVSNPDCISHLYLATVSQPSCHNMLRNPAGGISAGAVDFGGVLAAPIRGIEPYMGWFILGICFAVVVIGGMGSFVGAILGGLIVGLSQSLVTLVMPSASIIVIFLVMATILLIKPRGLMGIRD